MKTYVAAISETLQKYGLCVLPGIGRLELVALPAERSFQDNTLRPPTFKIILTGEANANSGPSVVDQIARNKKIERSEAEQEWQTAVRGIKKKLSTGSSVPLGALGLFNLSEDGGISFASAVPLFFASVPLRAPHEPGQPVVEEPQPAQPVPTAAKPVETKEIPREPLSPKEESRARWWIAGSIALLLIIGWFTYMGTRVRERKKDTLSEILKEKPADQGERLDSMKQTIDSMRTAHKLAHDSIHYKIIIATYDNKDKAEHQYRRMKEWGHPVELLTKDSVYELAWPFTSIPSDTTVNMVKMMNLYGKNVHIEYDNP